MPKIIDIRNTELAGWVADVMLSPKSILSVSIPIMQCNPRDLEDYCNTDPEHIAIADPRSDLEITWDELAKEWEETYQTL